MKPRVVQLFPTCLVDELFPEVGIAVVELLERAGIEVEVPEGLTCCGQPAFNAGFRDEAKSVAGRTIALLAATQGPIVIPSGSCADMLVHQSLELFRDEPRLLAQARAVADRCFELTQFLAALAPFLPVAPSSAPLPDAAAPPRLRVAYHPSCHLARGLGVKEEPKRLLAEAGIELVPLPDSEECCGFGGAFSVKQPDLSGALLDRKCRALEASGADAFASCDSGCLLHLAGGLRRRGSSIAALHVAQLLARRPR